jgi:hypothetical protein
MHNFCFASAAMILGAGAVAQGMPNRRNQISRGAKPKFFFTWRAMTSANCITAHHP